MRLSIFFISSKENFSYAFNVPAREPFEEKFDAIFNLFTSFGYFENEEDNLNTIKAIKSNLNAFGFGVIDFMNSEFIIDHLVAENTKTVDSYEDFKAQIDGGGFFLAHWDGKRGCTAGVISWGLAVPTLAF